MIVCFSDLSEIRGNPDLISRYEAVLSNSDKRRYHAMTNENRRLEFLVGRALVLDACSQTPQLLANGKPIVSHGYISLSHSCPYIFLAVSYQPVGIDIENTIKEKDYDQLAKRLNFRLGQNKRMSFYKNFTRYEADYKTGLPTTELTHKHYYIDTFIICISLLNNKENIQFIKTIPLETKTPIFLKEEPHEDL